MVADKGNNIHFYCFILEKFSIVDADPFLCKWLDSFFCFLFLFFFFLQKNKY